MNLRKFKKGRSIFGFIVGLFITSFFAITFGFAGGFVAVKFFPNKIIQINKDSNSLEMVEGVNPKIQYSSKEEEVVRVVEKASPAVVSIVVTKDIPLFRSNGGFPFDPFGFFNSPFGGFENRIPRGQQEELKYEKRKVGGGTGFFVSEDGLIVTNKHVVEDIDAEYTVLLGDEEEYSVDIIARHPVFDIAILKVVTQEDKKFPVLTLGSSDDIRVGQYALAIGNSLGEFSNSVSLGIISGLSRNLRASDGRGNSESLNDIIQTDAAINPGNSGGPLLDINGNVIGVNVAVARGAENVGFALPINQVKKIVEQVKEKGEITVAFLGIRYVLINKEIQEKNRLTYDYGALVSRGETRTDLAVLPGSPADKVGIIENDIILEINGEKVTEKNDIRMILSKYSVGDKVKIKVLSKGNEKEIEITLESR